MIHEMTLDEKIQLIHGVGWGVLRAGPPLVFILPRSLISHARDLLKVLGGVGKGKCIGVTRKMDESGTNMKATG
jgi:hypothetical protein